jgi:hypothetical protein
MYSTPIFHHLLSMLSAIIIVVDGPIETRANQSGTLTQQNSGTFIAPKVGAFHRWYSMYKVK